MPKKDFSTNHLKSKLKILCVAAAMTSLLSVQAYEIDPDATIYDSPTTLLGVNHIGLSVKDLDAVLEFYQSVSDFKLVSRETVGSNSNADKLFGFNNIEFEVAVLEAPNMLFELTEFKHNRDKPDRKMLVQGPGMTHTCFQTPSTFSGYDRFKGIGAEILSRGETAVDLGGYGVTYAYAYDPEGNMFELEQLDLGPLSEAPNKVKWVEDGMDMWMTQVALVTHDLERLTDYYAKILAFAPYREGDYVNHPRMVEIADADNLSLLVTWFRMNASSKTLNDIVSELLLTKNSDSDTKLAIETMRYACELFVGEHDFRNFSINDKNAGSTVRKIFNLELLESSLSDFGSDIYYFEIQGNGFLRHMIRYIVGALFELAKGTISIEGIEKTLQARQIQKLSAKVKSKGLHLIKINY